MTVLPFASPHKVVVEDIIMYPTISGIFFASVLLSLTSTVLLIIYVKWNDSRLANIPTAALCLSPHRATKRDVIELNERMRVRFQETENQEKGRNGNGKTGRRYIIVGGVCYRLLKPSLCDFINI